MPLVTDRLDAEPVIVDIHTVQNSGAGQYAHTDYTSWVTTNDGAVVIDSDNYRICVMIKEAFAKEDICFMSRNVWRHYLGEEQRFPRLADSEK